MRQLLKGALKDTITEIKANAALLPLTRWNDLFSDSCTLELSPHLSQK
jgi:hypothetical protein